MNRYRKGWRAELELMKMLKESGEYHTVLRSAGSRSAIDVVAIGKDRIFLCQVKTGKGGYGAVLRKLKEMVVPPCVTKTLGIRRRGREIKLITAE